MLVHDPYYDVQGVSNSSLKHINPKEGGSPFKFKEHWDKKAEPLRTSSLEFGNLLHLAVLEPHLCEYEVDVTNTPDKIRDILKGMYEGINTSTELANVVTGDTESIGPLEDYVYAIVGACNACSYGNTWKDETRIGKVMSQGSDYWDLLRKTDKFIITQDQYELLKSCLESIHNNTRTTQLLINMADPNGTYYNELEVHWTDHMYEFPLKAKIDRLYINTNDKTYKVIDLKTTAKTLGQFHESFEKYRYARQVAFYNEAARQYLKQNGYEGYQPDTPLICAVETKGQNRVGIFAVGEETVSAGHVEAEDLLHRLNHHFKTGNWINEMETNLGQVFWL